MGVMPLFLVVALVVAILGGCKGPPPNPCQVITHTSPAVLTAFKEEGVPSLSHPNTIATKHGWACGLNVNPKDYPVAQLDGESTGFPKSLNRGTVILNGWKFRYRDTDRYVAGLGTVIEHVSFIDGTMRWTASGAISDENSDDVYEWCYWYTAVAWNDAVIDARPYEPFSGICGTRPQRAYVDEKSRAGYRSLVDGTPYVGGAAVGVIPRGFALWGEEHEVLQVAYHVDHSEHLAWVYEGQQPPAVMDDGHVTWETEAFFKDEKPRRFRMDDLVGMVGGNGVTMVQPPFRLQPFDILPHPCSSVGTGVKQDKAVFESLPFTFAIPMLTGWELRYSCGDEYVRTAGMWIESFAWNAGRLEVSTASLLEDNDAKEGFTPRAKIGVLGLVSALPDLRIVQPDPTERFCRRRSNGTFVITVQNAGGGFAGASKTNVLWQVPNNTTGFNVSTPPLAPGATADIETDPPPPSCFKPKCFFTLTADSPPAVTESIESNNEVTGECSK